MKNQLLGSFVGALTGLAVVCTFLFVVSVTSNMDPNRDHIVNRTKSPLSIKKDLIITDGDLYMCARAVLRFSGVNHNGIEYYGGEWYVPRLINIVCCPTYTLADGRCTEDILDRAIRWVYYNRTVVYTS
jgi:hypothetical protein